MTESIQKQESEVVASNPAGNGLQSGEMDHGSVASAEKDKSTGKLSTGKATGPRTALGKKRSSQNSIKFGIFSRATLLEGESRSEYQSLLKGFWETFAPEGKFEEFGVEKLVSISWRYKRLLLAEGAEISKNSKFLRLDRQLAQQEEAEEISHELQHPEGLMQFGSEPVGLIWKIQNPAVLERCLELLVELQQGIKANGLNKGEDGALLKRIYGDSSSPHLHETLSDAYSIWLETAEVTEEERERQGCATPQQCKQIVLREISSQIRWLKQNQKERESIETERMKVEILRQGVPDSEGLDRLLRYASSLERDFDRTLNQLERAQRTRKGLPVPPRVDVNINS